MATSSGPQHPFWSDWTDDGGRPQEADSSLIGRLLASAPSTPHVVSLPVDHRKTPRVIRLHEPHLDRSLTENDRFDHWRRWMIASKRKELAR